MPSSGGTSQLVRPFIQQVRTEQPIWTIIGDIVIVSMSLLSLPLFSENVPLGSVQGDGTLSVWFKWFDYKNRKFVHNTFRKVVSSSLIRLAWNLVITFTLPKDVNWFWFCDSSWETFGTKLQFSPTTGEVGRMAGLSVSCWFSLPYMCFQFLLLFYWLPYYIWWVYTMYEYMLWHVETIN